jgi:hypothetical protein
MGKVVGMGYEGDASVLTEEQRKRLIEKMTEKFNVSRAEVEKGLEAGVVPIKADGVTVTWCERHVRAAVM